MTPGVTGSLRVWEWLCLQHWGLKCCLRVGNEPLPSLAVFLDSLGPEATLCEYCEDHLGMKEDARLYFRVNFQEGAAGVLM